MLKQRILTALVLVPLVVLSILYAPLIGVAILFAVLLMQGAWEWSRLSGVSNIVVRILYISVLVLVMIYLWSFAGDSLSMLLFGFVALAAWLLAFTWVLRPELGKDSKIFFVMIKLLAGLVMLLIAWYALVSIHSTADNGPMWALYALALTWVADSGAYFAGKSFGKNKLAPKVSPGKTWEGVAGAVIMVLIYTWLMSFLLGVTEQKLWLLLLISFVLVPFSVVGDLFESLMKRQSGIKDSGTLLPGHGGVMDRVDALIAVLPLFMLFAGIADLI